MSLVDIQVEDRSSEVPDERQLSGWIETIFSVLKRSPTALTIRIVDEEEMKELNRRYRGKNRSTNVLSFPFEPLPNVDVDLLGDIVLCGTVVAREATTQKKSLMGHWAHMIVHGMLHLFGYDHESDQEATVMEALEKSVLEGLGYSDPYQGKYDSSTDSRA